MGSRRRLVTVLIGGILVGALALALMTPGDAEAQLVPPEGGGPQARSLPGASQASHPSPAPSAGASDSRSLLAPGSTGATPADAGSDSATTAPGASADPEWSSVVAALDQLRASAFKAGDAALLAEVDVAGSPALASDEALLDSLSSRDVHPSALHSELISVTELPGSDPPGPSATGPSAPAAQGEPGTGSEVSLLVVDIRGSYRLLDPSGATVEAVPASPKRRWRMTLRPAATQVGWRVWEVAEGE